MRHRGAVVCGTTAAPYVGEVLEMKPHHLYCAAALLHWVALLINIVSYNADKAPFSTVFYCASAAFSLTLVAAMTAHDR